jgi:hypothetical protein
VLARRAPSPPPAAPPPPLPPPSPPAPTSPALAVVRAAAAARPPRRSSDDGRRTELPPSARMRGMSAPSSTLPRTGSRWRCCCIFDAISEAADAIGFIWLKWPPPSAIAATTDRCRGLAFGDWSSGPVFSTMACVVAPCLSALLLPPLVLLLLASSANKQVRVVCVLSSAVTRPRSRRAADAVKNAVVAPLGVGAARPTPSLASLARRCCGSCSYAVCGNCERSLGADVGCALHVPRRPLASLGHAGCTTACTERRAAVVLCVCALRRRRCHVSWLPV